MTMLRTESSMILRVDDARLDISPLPGSALVLGEEGVWTTRMPPGKAIRPDSTSPQPIMTLTVKIDGEVRCVSYTPNELVTKLLT